MAMVLALRGYVVQTADDGPSGLEVAQEFEPDVVLLDIGLPGLDGYQVAAALRVQERKPRPTIIAITGYGTDMERKRSYQNGIDMHMVKPVDPFELCNTLEHLQRNLPARPRPEECQSFVGS